MGDRRIRKNHKAITDAFISLLERKSYSQITIQNIIDTADISRSTFYSHFDTKDDLLIYIFVQLFDSLHTQLTKKPNTINVVPISYILNQLKGNKSISSVFFNDATQNILTTKFHEYWEPLIKNHLLVSFSDFQIPIDFLVYSIVDSCLNMMKWWYKNNMPYSPEIMEQYWYTITYSSILSSQGNNSLSLIKN